MRVLSIGSDEHVFEKGSAVRDRQEAYAKVLGHLDLAVPCKETHSSETHEALSLVPAYGSGSLSRLLRARKLATQLPKPDVVTVQDPFELGFVGWLVARHFRAPLHVQVHTDLRSPGFLRHSYVNRFRAVLAGFVLKRAARIRVVSPSIKATISRGTLDIPVSVLPVFVDVQKQRSAAVPAELAVKFQKFRTKLLVVARLEPEKNVELAIDAFARAAPDTACLIIVGEGSERKRLEEHARALNIHDRVLFEGARPSAPYYHLADLILVPSKYEGYGLVTVEALAAGKPVLSTDVGIAREAGAIVSSESRFEPDLKQWFENGPREGRLKGYPYNTFEDYVRMYSDDIAACVASAHR